MSKSQTVPKKKEYPWFVETSREAENFYLKDSNLSNSKNLPIASPIFSVQKEYNSGLKEEKEAYFKTEFPFQQKIRGNGACYFNACLTGILNRCVNDVGKWNQFRENLINHGCLKIADEIGKEGKNLTRQEVNDLLQVRGNDNIIVQLTHEILVPFHQEFINKRLKLIEDLEERIETESLSEDTKGNLFNVINSYKKAIDCYITTDIASIYEESDVLPFIESLTQNLDLSFRTIGKNELEISSDFSAENIDFSNTIFLWNRSGNAHFDLLYHKSDTTLLEEISTFRNDKEGNRKKFDLLSEEANSKIDQYLSNPSEQDKDFSKLFKEISRSSPLDDKSREFLLSLIEEYEKNKALIIQQRQQNTDTATNTTENATANALNIILAKQPLSESIYSQFIQDVQNSLINNQDPSFRHFIINAALVGNSDVIKPLYEAGEDFSAIDLYFDNTALTWAIANANNQFAYDLLEFAQKNADATIAINHKTEGYNTALHLAVAKGYLDKDSDNRNVGKSNLELVRNLLKCGADPNITNDINNDSGCTALDLAVARRDVEMVQEICNCDILDIPTLEYALNTTIKKDFSNSVKIVKNITSKILEIDQCNFTEEVSQQIEEILKSKLEQISPPQQEENLQQNNNNWRFSEEIETITPALEPNTIIEVISAEPIVTNQQSIWINEERGNRFRVISGVYENFLEENQNLQAPIGRTFIGILQKIADEENLNTDQVLEIIDFAKRSGGTSRKYNLTSRQYEDEAAEYIFANTDLQTAQRFSALFQKECEKCGIYTGREGANVKMVGLRLTFIPDDVVEFFQTKEDNDNQPFLNLVSKIQDAVKTKKSSQAENDNESVISYY